MAMEVNDETTWFQRSVVQSSLCGRWRTLPLSSTNDQHINYMLKKIDHLGIAVRSLDESVPYYEKALGLKCEHREEVPSQKVRTAFFSVGEVHLELLEPTDPESLIAKFLEKNPNGGIHHIAFGTDDISAQLQQASGAGVRLINEKPFDGAAGKLVAFLHPKSTFGVLTEFCMPQHGSHSNH